MTTKKNSVRVTILGEEYTLRSAASVEETHAIANQVDGTIRELMQSGLVVESQRAAILACLRMAGELAQMRSAAKQLDTQIEQLSSDIRPWLPPAKRYD